MIYNATCNINDANSPNAEVKMGRFATSEFESNDEVGGVGGDGKLKILLIDCPDQGKVSLQLIGSANANDNTILELDNQGNAGVAKNVGIRVYYEDDQTKPIGSKTEDINVLGFSSQWEGSFIPRICEISRFAKRANRSSFKG